MLYKENSWMGYPDIAVAANGEALLTYQLGPNQKATIHTTHPIGDERVVQERFGLWNSRHIGTLVLGITSPDAAAPPPELYILDTSMEPLPEYGRLAVVNKQFHHELPGGNIQCTSPETGHVLSLGMQFTPKALLGPDSDVAGCHVVVAEPPAPRQRTAVGALRVMNTSAANRTLLTYAYSLLRP